MASVGKENETKTRVISDSTGLYRLQLSLRKDRDAEPRGVSPSRGLRMETVVDVKTPVPAKSLDELIRKYAAKQARLMELEKQTELVRFELMELKVQLEELSEPSPKDGIKEKAAFEVASLKKRVSTIFRPSTQDPQFFSEHTLKKKALVILTSKFVTDIKGKVDQQQVEFDRITKRGTEMARTFISQFSKRPEYGAKDVAELSFAFDNIASDHSGIDIDDYSDSDSD